MNNLAENLATPLSGDIHDHSLGAIE